MREPGNIMDPNAVAIVREMSDKIEPQTGAVENLHPNTLADKHEVIGHIPKLMATWVGKFLKRPTNSGKVVIKGKRVNRGGGFGLEIPCGQFFVRLAATEVDERGICGMATVLSSVDLGRTCLLFLLTPRLLSVVVCISVLSR